jgi:hypothetical protein
MLIVEHFFLIACDPSTGIPTWPRRTQGAAQLAAAALLLDLGIQNRLRVSNTLLHADASVPLNHLLLSEAVRALAAHPLTTRAALELVERCLHPLPEQVLDGLVRRDILHRNESRGWLLRRRVRYPLRSVQARNEALQRLRHAARAESDMHGLGLLLLADISGALPEYLDAREHESATRHLLALDHTAATDDTHAAFASVRAALLA